jgi:hypothetical protein
VWVFWVLTPCRLADNTDVSEKHTPLDFWQSVVEFYDLKIRRKTMKATNVCVICDVVIAVFLPWFLSMISCGVCAMIALRPW